MLVIRPETQQDYAAVYDLVAAAFGKPDEAELVNRIRPLSGAISLVAEEQAIIVGHILFTPVVLKDENNLPLDIKIAGLAPVAVLPGKQKSGIGGQLIERGLELCESAGFVGCVLLGHPEYYPRFGFQPSLSTFGITSTYDVPDPVFMAKELVPGAFGDVSGTIHYNPLFNGI